MDFEWFEARPLRNKAGLQQAGLERRWLPEGIPGITLLCLSVVDILLLSVPVSVIPV